jgi:hypothetical protein
MPARDKLNAAYFHGSLVVAALAGWACSSWAVFGVAVVVLLAGNLLAGEIRPTRRGR